MGALTVTWRRAMKVMRTYLPILLLNEKKGVSCVHPQYCQKQLLELRLKLSNLFVFVEGLFDLNNGYVTIHRLLA
jgi:hypothetical protein